MSVSKNSASPLSMRWGLRLHERRWLLFLGDVVVALLAWAVSLEIWKQLDTANVAPLLRDGRQYWLLGLVVVWVIVWPPFLVSRQVAARFFVVQQLLIKTGLFAIFYAVLYFLAPPAFLPRMYPLYFLAIAFALTLLWRLLTVRLFQASAVQRKLIIVGAGNAGTAILEALDQDVSGVFKVVGVIDDDSQKWGREIHGETVLGGHERLLELAHASHATDIVLAITGDLRPEMFQTLLRSHEVGLDIVRMPSLYELLTGRIPLNYLNTDWLLTNFFDRVQINDLSRLTRRTMDILGALVGLTILLVLLPFVGSAIWLESGFPIFYGQERVGRGGKLFRIYKFRSMGRNAESGQAKWAQANDQRVTRIGKLMRKTRIDEVPQFWNVLRGDMSLVGPRPERPEFVEMLEKHIPFYRSRLLVKPGITGWAQVNYDYGGSLEGTGVKLQYDLFYVKQRNLLMDVWIILRTFSTVFRFKGQ